jgi:hypothetical protein
MKNVRRGLLPANGKRRPVLEDTGRLDGAVPVLHDDKEAADALLAHTDVDEHLLRQSDRRVHPRGSRPDPGGSRPWPKRTPTPSCCRTATWTTLTTT